MKSIEISTSQNVIIKYELASPFTRVAAFVIDFIIISISYALLAAFFGSAFGSETLVLFLFVPFMFYTLIFESLMQGTTPGKRALQIRVMRVDGRDLQFSDYLMRWMFRMVDIYVSFGSLAIFSMVASEKYQRTGDFLANTTVVVLKKSRRFRLSNLRKFETKEDYQATYPQVVALNEQEMLLVKEVMDRYRSFPNAAHELALQTTTGQLAKRLNIQKPDNDMGFLRGLLKDYVILTR